MNLDVEYRGSGAASGTLYITEENCGGKNNNHFMIFSYRDRPSLPRKTACGCPYSYSGTQKQLRR